MTCRECLPNGFVEVARCPRRWRSAWTACRVLAIFFMLAGLGRPAHALEAADVGKPKWEAGIAIAALYYPHYPGADQERFLLLPLPYFVYRGEYIRADRKGLRGYLYNSPRLDLRLSLRGSLPVNSKDDKARAGMDNLDLLLEAGPSLQYKIFQTPSQVLRLDLPVRGAFSVGHHAFFRHQGWTGNPNIHYERYIDQWTITSSLGVIYSDSRYHGYFYNVGRKDVTADRPYYQARSGYTAAEFTVSVRRRVQDYFVGAKLSYYDLNGAANEDSPLMKQHDYLAVSVAFAWVLGESDQRVARH